MKAIKFIVLAVVAGCIFYQAQQKQECATNISMNKVEALAQSESGQEKIYTYIISSREECIVYVGGAYATGRKVSCWSGNEHPVCADCVLVNP